MSDLDDDFVDLAPIRAIKVVSPITFSTAILRHGTERVSISFSEAAISKLKGWPRFSVAWSAKAKTFRIRADEKGAFEAYKTQKGERYILRLELPRELRAVEKLKEPAPHRYGEDGATVFIIAPPAFHRPVSPAVQHKAIVDMARAAVSAPIFGRASKRASG